jgi:nitrogen-specific signal transduction histidine kinase/ActR/RegA family two-component response regulator
VVLAALSSLVAVLHSRSSARAVREAGQLSEQLWQSQKMEALGRLAGGVAHDFDNLLMVIDSAASLAAEALPQGHPAAEDIADVQKAAERAALITRQLLAFSRRPVLPVERVDVAHALGEISELLPRVLGMGVQLTVDLEAGLWPVAATPVQIEQVVLNLAANARDAMPAGGWFAVRGRNRTVAPGEAGRLPGGGYVELEFADTGAGMSEEVLGHLFEPFFTTKASRGSGLGLATCYGIAAQLGGAIEARSQPGRGTTFTLLLPRLAEPPGPAAPEPQTPVPSGPPPGAGTVLVVDDEPAVRGLMARVVRAAGHVALDAGGGAAALDLARRHPSIEVVLCDVQLGGDTAFAMLDELRRLRPDVHVILTSGYAQDPRALASYAAGGGDFLPKPFLPEALLRAVARALRHRRAAAGQAGTRPVPTLQG